MIQVWYLLPCLLWICEKLFYSLEFPVTCLKNAMKLSFQVLVLRLNCAYSFSISCRLFLLFVLSFFCALASLWFIKMWCDGSLQSGYDISVRCYQCVWCGRITAIVSGVSSYSSPLSNAVFAFFTGVWHSEVHGSLQSSDPLLLPSQ